MQDLNDKITDDDLTAAEWNEVPSEIQNVIENTAQALSGGDLNQLGKGVAQYAANGVFYTDGGAGNAYVLTQIGLKQVPPSYANGMAIEFIPANTNTGSATVNVAGLGVKNISDTSSGGEIISGARITMRYNTGTGEFEIFQTAAVPVAAGLIFGLTMSNAADADHDITVATGQAADSTNAFLLLLSSAITKQIDAAWVAGTNAGGLFSGSVAVDTWYHVFEIRKDSDGTIDVGFDTSVTAANIPAGYTAYRRIGSVLTDGSSNILPFTQRNGRFRWKTPINEFSGAISATASNLGISTPLGLDVIAMLNTVHSTTNTSSYQIRIYSPYDSDATVDISNATLIHLHSTTGGESMANDIEVLTNSASEIRTDASSAVANTHINTIGWIDFRGQ